MAENIETSDGRSLRIHTTVTPGKTNWNLIDTRTGGICAQGYHLHKSDRFVQTDSETAPLQVAGVPEVSGPLFAALNAIDPLEVPTSTEDRAKAEAETQKKLLEERIAEAKSPEDGGPAPDTLSALSGTVKAQPAKPKPATPTPSQRPGETHEARTARERSER